MAKINGGHPQMTDKQAKSVLKSVKAGENVPADHRSAALKAAAQHYKAEAALARSEPKKPPR